MVKLFSRLVREDRASFSKGFINNKKYEYGNYQKE